MERNPIEVFGQKGFPETSVTQFCLLSSPLCKKSSWTWFCPHAFQFIFPPASLISYFRKLPNIYILDIFTLDKSWNAPWLSAYLLRASPLWTHIVPSRPFGRTARHPKTQFIPGTASAILGTGQIVSFLSLWLGGGTPLPPFLFDLHPPQNRQTDSFILACLLKTEEKQRKYEDCLAKVKTRHLSHDIQVQTMGIFHGCPINDDNIGPLGINQTFCQSFS